MTTDQIMGLVRQVLPLLGGVAVTLGYLDQASASNLVNQGLLVVGAITTVVGALWSAVANSDASILQSTANMPNVKVIEVSDEELSRKTSSPKVRLVRR